MGLSIIDISNPAAPTQSGFYDTPTPGYTDDVTVGEGYAYLADGRAGLRIIDTILTSYTELVANPDAHADPAKRHAMGQVHTLLAGTMEARGKVLVKLNVGADDLEAIVDVLPSLKAPTVNELHDQGGFAVETVVQKSQINVLIPELRDRGASDILEIPIAKIVH